MKMNRWLLFGLLLACTIGVALVVLPMLPSGPGVTKENFDCIEDGMTRAEVEAILGGPANANANNRFWPERPWDEWENDLGDSVTICFDAEDRVKSRTWEVGSDDRTIWQKLLDRIPWGERKKNMRPTIYMRN